MPWPVSRQRAQREGHPTVKVGDTCWYVPEVKPHQWGTAAIPARLLGGGGRAGDLGAAGRSRDGDARFAAYDLDGEWIATSNNPSALAQVVALHDRAARLAAERATAEAAEVTADRTGPDDIQVFQRCVERADWPDWDSEYLRSAMPLSGRDGDPTPQALLHELGVDPDRDDPDGEIQTDLEVRYTNAFQDAYRDEILRIARERIAHTESESGPE